MQSASRQALAALREAQESETGTRTSAATLTTLADELYAVAGVLVGNPRLRRTLGDPATHKESRSDLLARLIDGKVNAKTLAIAKAAVEQRWSTPWDLCDALEAAGDDALFAAAEKNDSLDRVEDELFRLERILQGNGNLLGLLDEQTVDPARRTSLLDGLIEGKVGDVTLALLQHAVSSQRKRSILQAIDDLLEQATARQQRSVARVLSAVPLTDEQEQRLAGVLSDMYGRAISVRTALEPSLRGGLVIRVGDEIIDGSIATRLTTARNALTG